MQIAHIRCKFSTQFDGFSSIGCSILPHRKDLHIKNFIEDALVVVDVVMIDMVEVDFLEVGMVVVDLVEVGVVVIDLVEVVGWRKIT